MEAAHSRTGWPRLSSGHRHVDGFAGFGTSARPADLRRLPALAARRVAAPHQWHPAVHPLSGQTRPHTCWQSASERTANLRWMEQHTRHLAADPYSQSEHRRGNQPSLSGQTNNLGENRNAVGAGLQPGSQARTIGCVFCPARTRRCSPAGRNHLLVSSGKTSAKVAALGIAS